MCLKESSIPDCWKVKSVACVIKIVGEVPLIAVIKNFYMFASLDFYIISTCFT